MGFAEIINIISHVVIIIGIVFMFFGAVCLFKFRDFYPRLLVAAKIDTVGMLTLLFGICLRHGFSFFSAKVVLIIIIIMILNPMVAHLVARAAYQAGYQIEGVLTEDSEDSEDSASMENTNNS